MGALLNLHGLGRVRTTAVTGTEDWTRVDLEFDTDANDAIQVNCLLGGWGKSRGTAWYDDIGLELLSARELKPSVEIDASVRRAPISKHIYGQFIEHLGRCIYGGIWAEMIDDRKFFHPIGDGDSPWTAAGEPRNFGMNKTTPFVGAQTPEIGVWGNGTRAGIRQTGLALVARKTYTGRIVLAGERAAAPIDVTLVWGDGPRERQTIVVPVIDDAYRTTRLRFTAGATSAAGRLEITSHGKGTFRVVTVSLMPADNIEGFRPDVLQLLRELDAPIYRTNYAQTVNVIGAIKTTKTAAAFDTTGVVLTLYRARFGTIPVKVEGAPEPLDMAAAWRETGKTLTVAIVNPTATEQALEMRIAGAAFEATGRLWRISGASEMAYNEPGKPLASTSRRRHRFGSGIG